MKYSYIVLVFILTVICCACGIKGMKVEKDSTKVDINRIPNETEFSLEETIEHAVSMRDSVLDSFSKMQELAKDNNAVSNGVKSAAKVEKKYGERINELNNIDFTNMSFDELNDFMTEMTNLITVIREARDALTFG